MTAQITLAVGDHVRLRHSIDNHHQSYQMENTQAAFLREAVDGLILSIRDIKTGQLVREASGDLEQYVIELVYDNTFSPKYASSKNSPRTAESATSTPGWRRMRAILRDLAEKGDLLSTNRPDFLSESPLAKMLDGWKVIKVRSQEVSSLEKDENA